MLRFRLFTRRRLPAIHRHGIISFLLTGAQLLPTFASSISCEDERWCRILFPILCQRSASARLHVQSWLCCGLLATLKRHVAFKWVISECRRKRSNNFFNPILATIAEFFAFWKSRTGREDKSKYGRVHS